MRKQVFLFFAVLFTLTGNSQVNLFFDFTNAESTIEFLKKKNPDQRDIEKFLATPGVKAIIRKIKSNDSIARVVLTKQAAGEKLQGIERNFQYEAIRSNLADMERFIQQIKTNQQVIRDSVSKLVAYLPANRSMDVKVSFLLGGYSSGFTFSEADVFYIGTHQYKNDVQSIVNACQHEIFHNVQNLYRNRGLVYDALEKDLGPLYVFYLVNNFFVEGSAEYIADLDKADPTAPNIKFQKEHAAVNDYRMAENFYLADRLILDTYNDPEKTDPHAVYSILFDWNWNNPGYSMGKYMMKCLASEYGSGAVVKYLAADPLVFVRDYITLTRTKKDKYPHAFSDAFEKMIGDVLTKTSAVAAN